LHRTPRPPRDAHARPSQHAELRCASFSPYDNSSICLTGNGIAKFVRLHDSNLKPVPLSLGRRELQVYTAHAWLADDRVVIGTDAGAARARARAAAAARRGERAALRRVARRGTAWRGAAWRRVAARVVSRLCVRVCVCAAGWLGSPSLWLGSSRGRVPGLSARARASVSPRVR
jgi:hypothetical protein